MWLQTDYFNKQLLPQDVQKANELMPTTMMVNFTYYKNGSEIRQVGVIGVKAKLYPIDSMDVISRVSSKYSDKLSSNIFNKNNNNYSDT